MRSAAIMVAFAAMLAGCADPRAPDTLAGQRLEVGDQRLIGYLPAIIHGPAFGVPGVRCEPPGFPLQILEPGPDAATARRELAFVSAFNQAMIGNIHYTAAACEPFSQGEDWGLGSAGEQQVGSKPPPTETFEQIFGFPAP
jgi:hypothetical protein